MSIKNFILFCFQYDLSASQFSPDGRVFQVEYAQKAVENSGYVAFWHFLIFNENKYTYIVVDGYNYK